MFFITSRMEDSFLPYNLAISAYNFFFISIISRIFTFSLMERTSRLLLGLEALPASLLLRFGAKITVNKGFLNANTAITRQLIRTARKLEAEWWQVCGEAWVRGHRKMSQVLGAFGLLDFTMLRPVLAWRAFWNLWTFYFFDFPNSLRAAVNRGYGVPLTHTHTHTHTHTYIYIYIYI